MVTRVGLVGLNDTQNNKEALAVILESRCFIASSLEYLMHSQASLSLEEGKCLRKEEQ